MMIMKTKIVLTQKLFKKNPTQLAKLLIHAIVYLANLPLELSEDVCNSEHLNLETVT